MRWDKGCGMSTSGYPVALREWGVALEQLTSADPSSAALSSAASGVVHQGHCCSSTILLGNCMG